MESFRGRRKLPAAIASQIIKEKCSPPIKNLFAEPGGRSGKGKRGNTESKRADNGGQWYWKVWWGRGVWKQGRADRGRGKVLTIRWVKYECVYPRILYVCAQNGFGGWSRGDTNFTAPHFAQHPSAYLLSPSILDDNADQICIPKTLSDMHLPSHCGRWENIDNYWQNPKAWAPFHLEYCIHHFYSTFGSFSLVTRSRYWLKYLIAGIEASASGDVGGLAVYRSGCCFGWEVRLSLLVCAHFPMTQTLIKIIISVATRMALWWGLCRLRPGRRKAPRDRLFCLQANLVITVINTWHESEDRDRMEQGRIKGARNNHWDIMEHHPSRTHAARRGKWMSLIE